MAQVTCLRYLETAPLFTRPWASDRESAPASLPVLDLLAVPEVAFSLTATGMLALLWWLANPRLVASGVAGLVLLMPGVVGLAVLPVSAGGVLLLVFAGGSLGMEIVAMPGIGLHAVGGCASLTLAGLFLRDEWAGAHPAVVVPVAISVSAATYLAGRRGWRYTSRDPFTRSSTVVGQEAIVLEAAGNRGKAVVCGDLWTIRSREGELGEGQAVRVVERTDASLIVKIVHGPSAEGTT